MPSIDLLSRGWRARALEPTDLAGLAQSLARDVLPLPAVERTASARWYHAIAAGSTWDAWLIGWPPGTGIATHDHGRSAGALFVIEGELTESVLDSDGSTSQRVLTTGSTAVFAAGHVHAVDNVAAGHALSVHVYSPRLTRMELWEPERVSSTR